MREALYELVFALWAQIIRVLCRCAVGTFFCLKYQVILRFEGHRERLRVFDLVFCCFAFDRARHLNMFKSLHHLKYKKAVLP